MTKRTKTAKPEFKSHIRQHIMVTLSHNEKDERPNVTIEDIAKRFQGLYECRQIVISTEPHKDGKFHHHIAINNNNVSKNNLVEKVRAAFPELIGYAVHVSGQRSWKGVLSYITKVDKKPYTWGISVAETLYIAECYDQNKKVTEQKEADNK